jgi:hypothetical protein
LCQAGKEYTSRRGKLVPAKIVKSAKNKTCFNNCRFSCSKKLSVSERESIFEDFYKLSQKEKYLFYGKTTERCTKTDKDKVSRRRYTFLYYLDVGNDRHRVCKDYYLGTLAISQKPIYNFHENKKDPVSGIPSADKRGQHAKKVISVGQKMTIRKHIESFPTVESHYTRSSSKRMYLESNLSLIKMYDLYVEKCNETHEIPVKQSYYRYLFTTEYNLDFHMPKSDRCDLCEQIKILKQNNEISSVANIKYEKHILEKDAMRDERKADKVGKKMVVCFDLENVITLPKAGTSNFFYKRKLNLYNLTAHTSLSGQGYCAIWPETLSGRAGIDIASAVVKILAAVVRDNADITEIVTWSDSCVPQNRNSIMAYAVSDFLQSHAQIDSITMKYSVPGHYRPDYKETKVGNHYECRLICFEKVVYGEYLWTSQT